MGLSDIYIVLAVIFGPPRIYTQITTVVFSVYNVYKFMVSVHYSKYKRIVTIAKAAPSGQMASEHVYVAASHSQLLNGEENWRRGPGAPHGSIASFSNFIRLGLLILCVQEGVAHFM